MIEGIKTMQDLFDHIAKHLLTQNSKSMTPNGCAYRGYENASCAVGCLIEDKNYRKSIEGGGVVNNDVRSAIEASIGRELTGTQEAEPGTEMALLVRLQKLHDSAAVCEWRERLGWAAEDYKLKYPNELLETV
jgi:hypothetical protein